MHAHRRIGKIVEVCAEPGEYTYDASTEASIFDGDYAGDLGESFRLLVRQMKERFAFGGDTGKDQRVYYVNLKEIIGNKYGTPSEVPFKSYDDTTGLALLMRLRCFGEYSYRIVNPILFYTNVAGNDVDVYERSRLDSQLKSELLTACNRPLPGFQPCTSTIPSCPAIRRNWLRP